MTHEHDHDTPEIYGLMARFESPEALVAAANQVREAGYTVTDAYTPFPVHGLSQALGQHIHKTRLAQLIFLGGLTGTTVGAGMQYFSAVIHYPLNIGGRPLNSWPMFVPVAFELTILLAAFTAVFGMIALNGLPQPYHPVFNVKSFERASDDGFFLCIEARDPKFDLERTREFLAKLGPAEISEVEP